MPKSRLNGGCGQCATKLTLVRYKERVVRFCDKVANVYVVRNFKKVVQLSRQRKHHIKQNMQNEDLQPWEDNEQI